MPTVFITGATGFIGRALCVKMRDSGWRVLGSYRNKLSAEDLPAGVKGVQIEAIEDYDTSRNGLEGADAVIHLAGRAHIMNNTAAKELDIFRKINVAGTERLARAAAMRGVKRFIFISSVKVNGESSQTPYSEEDMPMPRDAYGVSKYEAEEALKRVSAETGLKTVTLRPPLVYGPGVKANFESLIKLVASGIPLPLKSVRNSRSLIYVGNLTDAIFTSAVHPKAEGETFMVSDCEDVSTPDLIRSIASAINRKASLFSLPPVLLKTLAGIIGKVQAIEKLTDSLTVDTGKIRGLLGWSPPFTLEEGIRETIRHCKL